MLHGLSQFQSTIIKFYYKDNSFKPLQDVPEDVPENVLKKNHNQCALEGNYNSDTIVVDILQPWHSKSHPKGL